MIYRSVDVWKRLEESRLVRYRCFELIPGGGYCVQSADFYDLPIDPKQCALHDDQFLELLSEESPEVRSAPSPTLEEAIERHEAEFS